MEMESVELKLARLEEIGDGVTKAVSERVNELREVYEQFAVTDPHNVSTDVRSRLDSLFELLQTFLRKLQQDSSQQLKSDDEKSQDPSAEESTLSLSDRVNKLEEIVKSCLESNQRVQIQSIETSEVSPANLTESTCFSNGSEDDLKTELDEMKLVIERIDQERQRMTERLNQLEEVNERRLDEQHLMKKDIKRIEGEKSEMEKYLRQDMETLSTEKKDLELNLMAELKRMDTEIDAVEAQRRQDMERVDKERLDMDDKLREQIERVDKDRLDVESELREHLERIGKDNLDVGSGWREEIARVDREMSKLETQHTKDIDRLESKRRAMRVKLHRIVSGQRSSHKLQAETWTKEKEYCTVLAKKVDSLEEWNSEQERSLSNIAKETNKFQVLIDALNEMKENSKRQPNTLKMVLDAQKDVNYLEAWLKAIDGHVYQTTRPLVGFSARLKGLREIGPWNATVDQLLDVTSNIGSCFNPKEGQFTAPHDGMFGFFVKIDQVTAVAFKVYVMSKVEDGDSKKEMEIPMYKDVPHTAFCLLDLKKDQQVFLIVAEARTRVKLCSTFTFSGWSIAYH